MHGIAIALYYVLKIPTTPLATQKRFGWIWMGATLVVVVFFMRRLTRARRGR